MSTGSVHSAAFSHVIFKEQRSLDLSMKATSGSEPKKGQAVKIVAAGTIEPAAATDFPIGVVEIAGDQNKPSRYTVRTVFTTVNNVKAKGGTLANGAEVAFDGTVDASDVPNVIAAVDNAFVAGIVLKGGAAGATIEVGILRSPYKKGTFA